MLEHHADFAADLVDLFQVRRQFHAVDKDAPGLMLFQTIDASDHRRFARPGRPANNDTFPAHDLEVDVAQNMKIAVPLVQLDELDRDGGIELRRLEQRSVAFSEYVLLHRRSPFVRRVSMARAYRDMP